MAFTSVAKKTNVFNSLGFSSRAESLEFNERELNIYRLGLTSFMEHYFTLHLHQYIGILRLILELEESKDSREAKNRQEEGLVS